MRRFLLEIITQWHRKNLERRDGGNKGWWDEMWGGMATVMNDWDFPIDGPEQWPRLGRASGSIKGNAGKKVSAAAAWPPPTESALSPPRSPRERNCCMLCRVRDKNNLIQGRSRFCIGRHAHWEEKGDGDGIADPRAIFLRNKQPLLPGVLAHEQSMFLKLKEASVLTTV